MIWSNNLAGLRYEPELFGQKGLYLLYKAMFAELGCLMKTYMNLSMSAEVSKLILGFLNLTYIISFFAAREYMF